jgi:serine/threonine protein phosphatase PrpC
MIVIASDGLFDVMSNEDVVKFIHDMMGENDDDGSDGTDHNDMSKIASELTKHAEVLGSVDNISVVIVLFDQ